MSHTNYSFASLYYTHGYTCDKIGHDLGNSYV